MTLSIRRTLLTVLLIPASLGLLAVGFLWFLWSRDLIGPIDTRGLETALWWMSFRPAGETGEIWALIAITFYVLLALGAEVALRRGFRRSPSAEMFFLRLFLLTLPLQAARLAILPVLSGRIAASVGLAAARGALFGRFFGITSLLCVGIFATDLPMRRSGALLGMGALASLAIAVMVPLDVTQPLGNLLYRSGVDVALALTSISLEVLAVVSLAGAAAVRGNSRYYMLALFLLFIVIGAELTFFAGSALVVPGFILIPVGTAGFAYEVKKIYQWI